MPRSKKRKHHHEFHSSSNAEKAQKNRSAVLAGIIFFALLGAGVAFFTAGSDPLWLLLGAGAGAAGGYFFGRQVDKSFSKK